MSSCYCCKLLICCCKDSLVVLLLKLEILLISFLDAVQSCCSCKPKTKQVLNKVCCLLEVFYDFFVTCTNRKSFLVAVAASLLFSSYDEGLILSGTFCSCSYLLPDNQDIHPYIFVYTYITLCSFSVDEVSLCLQMFLLLLSMGWKTL